MGGSLMADLADEASDMLEYVFFNEEPCARFQEFLVARGLQSDLEERDPERIIQVEESAVDDALADEIDRFYDEMFALDQALHESESPTSRENYHAAGVVVNLDDGRAVYAEVAPDLLSRVMSALEPQDLNDLVAAVVDAVENPDERSFCERMRDSTSDTAD